MDYTQIGTFLELIGALLSASALLGESRLRLAEVRLRIFLHWITNRERWLSWFNILLGIGLKAWFLSSDIFKSAIPIVYLILCIVFVIVSLLILIDFELGTAFILGPVEFGTPPSLTRLFWSRYRFLLYAKPYWFPLLVTWFLGMIIIAITFYGTKSDREEESSLVGKGGCLYLLLPSGAHIIIIPFIIVLLLILLLSFFLIYYALVCTALIIFSSLSITLSSISYIIITAMLFPYMIIDYFSISAELTSSILFVGVIMTILGHILQLLR